MDTIVINKFATNNDTESIPEQITQTALEFVNTAVIHNDARRSRWISNDLGIDFMWDEYEGFAHIILIHKPLASSEITLHKVWQFCDNSLAPSISETINTVKSMLAQAHLLDYLSAHLHTNNLGTMGWVNPYGEVSVFMTERLEGATRDHKVKVRTGYKDGEVSITMSDTTPFAFGTIIDAFAGANSISINPDMKSITLDADLFL